MKQFQKNIFIVWYQTDISSLKPIFKNNIKNWQLLNPKWKVQLINCNDLRNACKQFSESCLKTYDSFDLMHLKIDLGRYVYLYLYGGIYVDIDCYAFRSLDNSKFITELLKTKYKNILGLSTINLNKLESFLFTGNFITINNATMISSQKNPIIKKLITCISKQHCYSNFNQIQYTTGPIFINTFFQQKHTESHIKLFPHTIFEPTQPFGKNSYSNITDDTIAIHQFTMSWISDDLRLLIQLYNNIKYFILPILLILYCNFI